MADLPQNNQLSKQNAQSHVGVSIRIGGHEIGSGRIQSFNADHDFGLQAVRGVGDFNPVEHVHNAYDGTVTLDAFRIRTKDLVKLGLAALGKDILKLPVIDVVLYDKVDKRVYRVYEKCSCARYSERIQDGAICGENATFKPIDARDAA